jgi:urease accessory protein
MSRAASAAQLQITQPPGSHAELLLGWEYRGGRTLLTKRRQRGPLVAQRPFYPEGAPCHLYLLHPREA